MEGTFNFAVSNKFLDVKVIFSGQPRNFEKEIEYPAGVLDADQLTLNQETIAKKYAEKLKYSAVAKVEFF